MNPEEFHYIDKFQNQYFKNMREVRISSLYWVWDNLSSNSGSIRKSTIVSLIPYTSLSELLTDLESDERYDIMKKWKWEDYLIGGLASIWLVFVFSRFISMVM